MTLLKAYAAPLFFIKELSPGALVWGTRIGLSNELIYEGRIGLILEVLQKEGEEGVTSSVTPSTGETGNEQATEIEDEEDPVLREELRGWEAHLLKHIQKEAASLRELFSYLPLSGWKSHQIFLGKPGSVTVILQTGSERIRIHLTISIERGQPYCEVISYYQGTEPAWKEEGGPLTIESMRDKVHSREDVERLLAELIVVTLSCLEKEKELLLDYVKAH